MTPEEIRIPSIVLEWSEWVSWNELAIDARKGELEIPNKVSGVYQVGRSNSDSVLHIGKASNLHRRVIRNLIRGQGRHSTRRRILESGENLDQLMVRWAKTDRPAAVEEELHLTHKEQFGALPKYTRRT